MDVSPEASEICDGLDNDCDGSVDEGVQLTLYRDADGDGYGDPAGGTREACALTTGWVSMTGDCDDSDPAINSGNPEVCTP